MTAAEWYFDFVSPFSYLQNVGFDRLPRDLEIGYRPVLFAGLLNHWEHKGPAEIPAKRVQTYRHCLWWAERHDIPFKMPPAHPFNPLGALRLAIALECEPNAVRDIFRFVWAEGRDAGDAEALGALARRLGLDDPEARLAAPEVKAALRDNGTRAIELGVYGVPTFVVNGELFWGLDTTDLMLDYLKDPGLLGRGEMARIGTLPAAAARRGS